MTEPTSDLPTPSEFGESWDSPSATHGDFHNRPDFRGSEEQRVYCPCENPLTDPDPDCPVHGGENA